MGVCASQPDGAEAESQQSRQIDRQIIELNAKDRKILKLLLLGAGESGKSTLFKQCIQLYGRGFSEEERRPYASVIYNNVLSSMKVLIKQSKLLDLPYARNLEPYVKYVMEIRDDSSVNRELAGYLKAIWADRNIKRTYAARALFQLPDAASWFFDSLDRLAQDHYLPSYDDVLRCRARTTGICETDFQIKGNTFRLLDVGGQRSERKKWFHCFEDVTAVLFVAAVSEYDQKLAEDNKTNRLLEAIELFDDICNSRWLAKTSMILFLNKSDLFRAKIEGIAAVPGANNTGPGGGIATGIGIGISGVVGSDGSPSSPVDSPTAGTTSSSTSSSTSSVVPHSLASSSVLTGNGTLPYIPGASISSVQLANVLPSPALSLPPTAGAPLTVCFPEYAGGPSFEAACEHVKAHFLARNKFPETKDVFVHVTCATDTRAIKFTLDAVTTIVREQMLKLSGLL